MYGTDLLIQLDIVIADIHRTFPDNIYFQDTPSDPNAKRKPLFNVLVAFGHKNKQAGYCQVCSA